MTWGTGGVLKRGEETPPTPGRESGGGHEDRRGKDHRISRDEMPWIRLFPLGGTRKYCT